MRDRRIEMMHLIKENVEKVLKLLQEKTTKEVVKIKAIKGETGLLDSKFSGMPYLPQGFEYPEDDNGPLKLLAQINFAQMPYIKGFPIEGILQFYVGCDDLYGAEFDEPTRQTGFRVVYHKVVEGDLSKLQQAPSFENLEEDCFPILEKDLKLTFTKEEEYISLDDWRFEEMFIEEYNKLSDEPIEKIYDLPDTIYNELCEGRTQGHRVGGYPFFTQYDPREGNVELEGHTVLLFQMDTDNKENGIMFGDSGVCNFFIREEDLKNYDFSNVIYNWDCF